MLREIENTTQSGAPAFVMPVLASFQKMLVANLIATIATLVFSIFFAMPPVCGAAQDDQSFREFERNMVPTPQELYQVLGLFNANGSNDSGLGPADLQKLQETAADFFSKLTPEQQAAAMEFALKYLVDLGVRSAESRALMDQFGIPPDLQEQLAQQFGEVNPTESGAPGDQQSSQQKSATLAKLLEQARAQTEALAQGRDAETSSGSDSPVNDVPSSSAEAGSQPGKTYNWKEKDWKEKVQELIQKAKENESDRNASSIDPADLAGALESYRKLTEDGGTDNESAFQSLLSRAKETLTKSNNSSDPPKERLTARFDRLLVEAARRALKSEKNGEAESPITSSFDSLFDKVIEKVDGTVNPNETESVGTADGDWNFPDYDGTSDDASVASNSAPSSVDNATPGSSGNSPSDISDLLEGLPDVSSLSPKLIVTVAAAIGVCILIGVLSWRLMDFDRSPSNNRKFGKQFRNAVIRTPKDLVEAVDYFLVAKFGSESNWWNAKHAQDVLGAAAPDHHQIVRDLIRDYVHARYMRSELVLTEEEQQRYKTTLQALSKIATIPTASLSDSPETFGVKMGNASKAERLVT